MKHDWLVNSNQAAHFCLPEFWTSILHLWCGRGTTGERMCDAGVVAMLCVHAGNSILCHKSAPRRTNCLSRAQIVLTRCSQAARQGGVEMANWIDSFLPPQSMPQQACPFHSGRPVTRLQNVWANTPIFSIPRAPYLSFRSLCRCACFFFLAESAGRALWLQCLQGTVSWAQQVLLREELKWPGKLSPADLCKQQVLPERELFRRGDFR